VQVHHVIKKDLALVQYHCAVLFNNDLPGLSPDHHFTKRKLKTLRERIRGKGGRIR